MKYAFNTWVYGSFPVWLPAYPLDEVIRRLARIGYDGIEIGCAAPHAWPAYLNTKRREQLRRLLEAESLPAVSLLPPPGGGPGLNPASPAPEERAATVQLYKDVIDLGTDLGARLVLYIGGWQIYGTTREEAWKWSLDSLVACADHAQTKGVTLAVEPTPADSNLVETADDALELMRASERANVKVMFDTFHALYRNEVSADYVRAMGRDLVHMHAADANRLPPGEGVVDWSGVLQALEEVRFEGYVTMEIGFNTRTVEPDRIARRGLEYLRSLEKQTAGKRR